MGLQLIMDGIENITVNTYTKLDVSVLSQNGYKIPYRNLLHKVKGEKPLPIIIDFSTDLPVGAIVYAEIDGKNKRTCPKLPDAYGRYQLSFYSDDFSTVGIKSMRIWFEIPEYSIIEYVQEKFEFNVTYKERQV